MRQRCERKSSAGWCAALVMLVAAQGGAGCVQSGPPTRPGDEAERAGTVAEPPARAAPRLLPSATQPPDVEAAVGALLEAYERPGEEADWKRLGAPARAPLVRVLTSEEEFSLKRARAAEALGWVAGREEIALLAQFAARTSNPGTARMGALTGLGRALGEEAVPAVRPYLADADPIVRRRAAEVLALVGTDEARDALRQRLPSSPAAEREELRRLLER